ncbi:MAG: FtsX-like permease family protein [Bacteroidales bacterium]|nr:FtsX-like permease family protein [Bacteroidales bacterium]
MNLPFFVAWRYFFSKKKLKVINIISLISLIGIAVTTMALIIVLSVFNGFTFIGTKVLSSSYPPLIIEPIKGKTFNLDTIPFSEIRNNKKIHIATPIIQENALISFGENQSLVIMKGVETEYHKINNIDTSIVLGDYKLRIQNHESCILGIGLSSFLNIPSNAEKMGAKIRVMVPKRSGKISLNTEESFLSKDILYSGSFQMFSQIDEDNIIVPRSFARELLEYSDNEVNSIYIKPNNQKDIPSLKKELKKTLGNGFTVKTVLEQEPIYHKVVKSERLGVYIILSFIIFIATFNVMGALSLLIMDKKKDILILRAIGANEKTIRRIYFLNGILLSLFGALIGLILGSIICFIQQRYGIVKMGDGNFLVDAFPIKLKINDIISVFILVLLIGAGAVSIMVRRISVNNKINE